MIAVRVNRDVLYQWPIWIAAGTGGGVGGGFGHGVGLSQTGAVGMAEKGRTCDEILKHYYRDIDLVTRY